MKTVFFNTIGIISFGLGILGIFLPLLPTTCFMILSAWAFARSSPTFHAWLYYKSPFAESIQNWQQHRIVPVKVKWMATSSIIVSYIITLMLVENIYILSGVGICLLGVVLYLLSKPSGAKINVQAVTDQPFAELHQQAV